MTQPNEPINSISDLNNHPSDWYGLTKREYFAVHTDIPWNAVLETLSIKFPERNGKFSIAEFLEYQASIKVMAADILIKELNEQP